MNAEVLFQHYRKQSARMPRDPKFLEGMFVIRRTPSRFVFGEIMKASAQLQRMQIHDAATGVLDWVAFAALLDDSILFHSKGDALAVFNCLARQWQEDAAAEAA